MASWAQMLVLVTGMSLRWLCEMNRKRLGFILGPSASFLREQSLGWASRKLWCLESMAWNPGLQCMVRSSSVKSSRKEGERLNITEGSCCRICLTLSGFFLCSKLRLLWSLLVSAVTVAPNIGVHIWTGLRIPVSITAYLSEQQPFGKGAVS